MTVIGTDACQNEQLIKHYLRKDDVYAHADLHGAATCISCIHAIARVMNAQNVLLLL